MSSATRATRPSGLWRDATVRSVEHPRPDAVMLRLEVPGRIDHLPGQHYVVRLTAEDGYRAQRSYSAASPPSDPLLELYVERLDDGEVSTYLADVVVPGDTLEVRGPIGRFFVWDGETAVLGVAGGTGVVPMVSMLRHARLTGRQDRLSLAVSSRTWAELPYAEELAGGGALIAVSREDGRDGRPAGRLTVADLQPLVGPDRLCLVCGSAAFTEGAGRILVEAGVEPERIRVERFGPSG